MHRTVKLLSTVFFLCLTNAALAAPAIWQEVAVEQSIALRTNAAVRYYQADDSALRNSLADVPHETSGDTSHQIRLPMPDGNLALFSVVESPIIAPEFAARYPEIKTFRVDGVDNKDATGRIDITPLGFHGMIRTAKGSVYIDPLSSPSQSNLYLSRYKGSAENPYRCEVHGSHDDLIEELAPQFRTANRVPGNRIEYRIAIAATFEYLENFGGNVASARAQIISTINRVNVIYQLDLGILLTLVLDDALYETVDLGELDNSNPLVLLGQVNDWIDMKLMPLGGDAAYDIGHIFSSPTFGGAGVANVGVVCNDASKAGGVSGIDDPTIGDPFDIDLVAHEIGHQFNAEHTFNGTDSSCGTNRNPATAYEPGSGSTIMAYAGICATENLQSNSEATFHAGSIAQIQSFTAGAGSCYNPIPIPSPPPPAPPISDPVLAAITGSTIPANTPFVLDGNATDVNMDTLDYQWDQMDAGCPTDASSFGTDNGSNALFRSYLPRPESWRNFPALGTQAQGLYDKAEVLPCQNRDLNFRLTVRDNNTGQDFKDVTISVDPSAGPFQITNLDPAPPIFAGTPFLVTWDIAGTNLSPISCASVDFDLISFGPGYASYSVYPLVASTSNDNDNNELVTLNPSTASHPRSRVRVKCSDNVFYDLSDVDLTVMPDPGGADIPLDDTEFTAYSFANIATTGSMAPACGAVVDCSPPPVIEDDSSGSSEHDASAFGFVWMLLLAGLAVFRHCLRPA